MMIIVKKINFFCQIYANVFWKFFVEKISSQFKKTIILARKRIEKMSLIHVVAGSGKIWPRPSSSGVTFGFYGSGSSLLPDPTKFFTQTPGSTFQIFGSGFSPGSEAGAWSRSWHNTPETHLWCSLFFILYIHFIALFI